MRSHCSCWEDEIRPCCWCGYDDDDVLECVELSDRRRMCIEDECE